MLVSGKSDPSAKQTAKWLTRSAAQATQGCAAGKERVGTMIAARLSEGHVSTLLRNEKRQCRHEQRTSQQHQGQRIEPHTHRTTPETAGQTGSKEQSHNVRVAAVVGAPHEQEEGDVERHVREHLRIDKETTRE